MCVIRRLCQFLEELFKRNRRVHHNRLHLGEILQVRIQIDRVENAEVFLPDLGALARGAADHLLVEDAAVDPAQENKVVDASERQCLSSGDRL